MNHYDVLGVLPTATPEEIQARFRRIAMKAHPDRTDGDAKSALLFKQAKEAYETLFDATKREEYDRAQLNLLVEDPSKAAEAAWHRFVDKTITQSN